MLVLRSSRCHSQVNDDDDQLHNLAIPFARALLRQAKQAKQRVFLFVFFGGDKKMHRSPICSGDTRDYELPHFIVNDDDYAEDLCTLHIPPHFHT